VRPLVILRPEPGASATAGEARAMGMTVLAIPLFEVVPVEWSAPDPSQFDAIVMTSANAVRHGGAELDRLRRLPVLAVGPATAAAARAAGFTVSAIGEGGARNMNLPAGERLLHLAGREHVAIGAATVTIPVYEAIPIATPEGLDGIGKSVVAVHSPRAGRRLGELVTQRSQTLIAAISRAAAEACGPGWKQVHAAHQPSDAALLALAARLCESPAP
jgi:uroporphyrinogen-III synthase